MIRWASLTVALFSVLPIYVGSEVVDSFNRISVDGLIADGCQNYFYKHEEPVGFDQNAKRICQKMDGEYFYATLYSTEHRIPLYSAYTFGYDCHNEGGRNNGKWFIEPQLSKDENEDYANVDSMTSYSARSEKIKVKQAINEDYAYTGYDRGHLNPNSFQCNDGRIATFTLTNSAPMDPRFNRVQWKNIEAEVKKILKAQDRSKKAYLVTGVVPASNDRIPRKEVVDDPNTQELNRVTIPTHVWTAVCYIHPKKSENSFSFGVIGENKRDGCIYFKTILQLTQELSEKYNSKYLRIFKDHCFFPKSKEIIQGIYLYNNIKLGLADPIIGLPEIMNIIRIGLILSGRPKVKLSEGKIDLVYNDRDAWMKDFEEIRSVSRFTCPLSLMAAGIIAALHHHLVSQRVESVAVLGVTALNIINFTSGVKLKMGRWTNAVEELIASLLLMARPARKKNHAASMVKAIFGATPQTVLGIIVVPHEDLFLPSCTLFFFLV